MHTDCQYLRLEGGGEGRYSRYADTFGTICGTRGPGAAGAKGTLHSSEGWLAREVVDEEIIGRVTVTLSLFRRPGFAQEVVDAGS